MEEKILEILEERCEEALYYEEENMMSDGIIDSYTAMSVITDIEEEFDIEIDAKYVVADAFKNKDSIIALAKNISV